MANPHPVGAGQGRKPGSKNKATKAIKEMIEGALSAAGGQEYLLRQAEENPVAFMGLVGKILPRDLNVNAEVKMEWNAETESRLAFLLKEAGIDSIDGIAEDASSA